MQVFEIFNESGKAIACFRPVTIKLHGKKADKIITHRDVDYKPTKWTKNTERKASGVHAEINLTKQSIRIFGMSKGNWDQKAGGYVMMSFDRTFKVGDTIEIGSYNLTYTEEIFKITPNNVVYKYGSRMKMMELAEFIRRNWDLDLEKIARENAITRQYI